MSLFFTDPPTTAIYPLSLHDALPIWSSPSWSRSAATSGSDRNDWSRSAGRSGSDPPMICAQPARLRSEEHTSELQSHVKLVCGLLLEKKTGTGGPLGHGHWLAAAPDG